MKIQKFAAIFSTLILFAGCGNKNSIELSNKQEIPPQSKQEEAVVEPIKETLDKQPVEVAALDYEIIDEKESETLFKDNKRYEVVGITGEKKSEKLSQIGKEVKSKYQDEYNKYGDIQVYIFSNQYKAEASKYLRISETESINYDKYIRATLNMRKDIYSLFYIFDDTGEIIEAIENF